MFNVLKKFFNFTLYSLTALTACFFSLMLVLQFLNPAFSNTSSQAEEKLTFKKVFSDIWSNLKLILKDLDPKNKKGPKQSESSPQSEPSPPPNSFEGNVEGVTVPNKDRESIQDLGEYGKPSEDLPPSGDMPLQGAEDLSGAPSGESIQSQGAEDLSGAPSGEGIQSQGAEDLSGAPSGDMPLQGAEDLSGAPSGDMPLQGAEDLSGAPSGEGIQSQSAEMAVEDQLPSEVSLEIQSDMAPFIYENPSSRSPFDDPTRKNVSGKVVEKSGEAQVFIPKTPPEMYELSQIKLKGIIWNTQNPKALFELPSGEGHYTLIKGDRIGKNGLIFEIREDEVVIVETFYKGENSQTTERVIKIKKMDRLKLNEGVET